MVQAPRKFISRVCVDSLEETENDPNVHGKDVQILGHSGPDNRDTDSAEGQDHGLYGRGVLGGKAKWSAVLVVQLVDLLVQLRGVEGSVKPVMPCIFQDEKDSNLVSHGLPGRKGHARRHAEILRGRVEQPYLRKLDGEVGEKDKFGALPLFGQRWHFVLVAKSALAGCPGSGHCIPVGSCTSGSMGSCPST